MAMPNSDSAFFFTVNFNGTIGGDAEQVFISTSDSKQLGGFNVHYYTNGSWLPAATRGKIRVWIEGVTVAGSTPNLLSTSSFTGGTYQFCIRRTGDKLQLLSCLVNGQKNNPVVLQSEITGNYSFTHPSGIIIGNRAILQPTLYCDQSISRVGQINSSITDAQISDMAFGTPINKLGKTPVWYTSLRDTENLDGFLPYNNPLTSAEPNYGYVEDTYCSFEKPFAATSLWNSRPVNPVLGTFVIPPCYKEGLPKTSQNKYYIDITAGSYSSGIYRASPSDSPMVVYKRDGQVGILDKDADEKLDSVTINHWPIEATGAEGSDGHCDIIDEEAKVIHSFWILKKNSIGNMSAQQYTWAPLDGSGWGDGAHYYTGARATGVATCAGMIRKDEINDGKPMYEHALACSLDYTGLSANPAYCVPATSSDGDPQTNSGDIPQGALIMLPQSYDTSRLNNWPTVKKVVETLKVYGARVVDRNQNTPLTIYVEKNAGWRWHPAGVWDSSLANELEYIREQIRQVVSTDKYINALQETYKPLERQNMLSMRGPWFIPGNGDKVVKGLFNSINQSISLPATGGKWRNNNSKFRVPEIKPIEGKYYKLTCRSDCGASFNFTIYNYPVDKPVEWKTTPTLNNDQSVYIKWGKGSWFFVEAYKNPSVNPGYLKWDFIEIPESEYLANTPKFFF